MRMLKKAAALILVLNMVLGMVPDFIQYVFAAPSPANVFVESYNNNEKRLTIKWFQSDIHSASASAEITYHVITAGGVASEKTVTAENFTKTSSKITVDINEDFLNDTIYDFKVNILDSSGSVIGQGMLYFMPQITFRSEIQPQEPEPASTAGGKEIGSKPLLNLKWNKPRVWDGDSFENVEDSVGFMEAQLNSVYHNNIDISKVDYLVGIQSQSSVEIGYGAGNYSAKVANSPDSTRRDVNDGGSSLNFYLLGRKDSSTPLPATDAEIQDFLPAALESLHGYVLPHGGIFPGTVYNMSIKPVFKQTDGNNVYALTVGDPSKQNDSTLYTQTAQSLVPYAYTPIRFKLTKDDLGNVYVDIHRLNQGSLSMPNLYYQVQVTNDYSIPGEWPEKARMNDEYFNGDIATTVISDIDPENKMYYRIVVWSNNQVDRLQSWYMDYKIQEDSSRPPAPKTITVTPRDIKIVPSGERTTNISVQWEKPSNYEAIKSNLYFHFELNTSQTEQLEPPYPTLQANGKAYGQFPLKYRLVRYVKATSAQITESNGFLTYHIDGDTLFKHDDDNGNGLVDGPLPDTVDGNTYPTFLLPNTVYYLRMYTTSGTNPLDPDSESNKSIVTSFTTLSGTDLDVPVPKNLKGTPGYEVINNIISSYIEIEFDKISMNIGPNDKIYYDLYMSSNAVDFTRIGSTDSSSDEGNVHFVGTDLLSASIKATVKDFLPGTGGYQKFGSKLLPNTTYYFTVKTRLKIENRPDRESVSTVVLPVTTLSGSIGEPDDDGERPLAPVDFSIAKDENGNPMVSGTSVTFTWTRPENTSYVLIASSSRVDADASLSSLANDPVFQSFSSFFSANGISLNPDASQNNFSYDPVTRVCKYTINQWLYPNRLYYFSLRSVAQDGTANPPVSVWISIPVTTSLIDAPSSLVPVNDAQLGFSWEDNTANAVADDYRIYLKGPKDEDFIILNRTQSTVVKDGNKYYGRVMNLKANTQYKVKVCRGTASPVLVMPEKGMITRDAYHEVEVSWKGLPGYTYEIAVKAADDTDYITLISSDFDLYTEKTSVTVGTSYSIYYARIKSCKVVMAGGTSENRPLKSNTKYYVKVRAVKVETGDTTYSKYAGPVEVRTEFNQKDYDDEDEDTKEGAAFLDKIDKLEQALFWRVDMGSRTDNKILLKGDRVSNALENSGRYGFTLDISSLAANASIDVIYIPVDVIRTMNSENKNIVIKTTNAEFTIRPNTFDTDNMKEIKSLMGKQGARDIIFRVSIGRTYNSRISVSDKTVTVTQINDFKLQAQASLKKYAEIKDLFHDKLYNAETGLVKQKMELLMDPYLKTAADQAQFEAQLDEFVAEVESELSGFIGDTIRNNIGTSGMSEYVNTFGKPIMARLIFKDTEGRQVPYVNYDGSNKWQDVSNNTVFSASMLTFNITKPGKYTIITIVVAAVDAQGDPGTNEYINRFLAKFDLSDVFTGIDKSFNGQSTVSIKEIILLYEKVTGKAGSNAGMDIRQKAAALKLDTILNMNNLMKDVSRQEAAVILVRVYSAKMGVNADSLKPKSNISIKDSAQIDSKCYKPVLVTLDLRIMQLKQDGYFKPKENITRADIITSFAKLLELTGDL